MSLTQPTTLQESGMPPPSPGRMTPQARKDFKQTNAQTKRLEGGS